MTKKLQAVLFDYDGTLIDSMPFIYRGMKAVMDRSGLPMPEFGSFTRTLAAPYLNWYRERGVTLSDDEIRRIFFETAFTDDAPYFPEVEEVLRKLRERGVFLGIVSAHPSAATIRSRVVERDGIFHETHPVIARAAEKAVWIRNLCVEHRLAPETTLYVGDLTSDIRDAKEAGTLSAAYLGPHGHRDAFEKDVPHYFLDSLRSIFDHFDHFGE